MERACIKQLDDQMKQYCPLPLLQSALRSRHSTETALIKVHSNIMENVDNQCVVLLIVLDLSAAFDSTDHKITLNVMENEIGATGNVKKWFESFLTGRSMRVTVDGTLSEPTEIH